MADGVGTLRTTFPVIEFRKTNSKPEVDSTSECEELRVSEKVVTAVGDLTH